MYNSKYQQIFQDYGFHPDIYFEIHDAYKQPHRYYHNLDHLNDLLKKIEFFSELSSPQFIRGANTNPSEEYETLVFIAFFHDCVYIADPNTNNEVASMNKFTECYEKIDHESAIKRMSSIMKMRISQAILDTGSREIPNEPVSSTFWLMDNNILFEGFDKLLEWERKIFLEWQKFDIKAYKAGRIDFLEKEIARQKEFHDEAEWNVANLEALISYVHSFKPRIGVYPGSFNPFRVCHYNILQKAEMLFDKVILLKGFNPEKKLENTYKFPDVVQHMQIEEWSGMTHEFLKKISSSSDPILVRGLRNGKDLDYEVNQLRFTESFFKDVKVVYIPCDKEYEHVSSSAIRNLSAIDPTLAKKYLME